MSSGRPRRAGRESEEVFDQVGYAGRPEPMRPMTSSMRSAGTPPIERPALQYPEIAASAQPWEASETKRLIFFVPEVTEGLLDLGEQSWSGETGADSLVRAGGG